MMKKKILSTETEPKLRQMLEVANKNIKTAITAVYCTFKKLSRDMEDTEKIPNFQK